MISADDAAKDGPAVICMQHFGDEVRPTYLTTRGSTSRIFDTWMLGTIHRDILLTLYQFFVAISFNVQVFTVENVDLDGDWMQLWQGWQSWGKERGLQVDLPSVIEKMDLRMCGTSLEIDGRKTLREYGLRSFSTVYILGRLRGGAQLGKAVKGRSQVVSWKLLRIGMGSFGRLGLPTMTYRPHAKQNTGFETSQGCPIRYAKQESDRHERTIARGHRGTPTPGCNREALSVITSWSGRGRGAVQPGSDPFTATPPYPTTSLWKQESKDSLVHRSLTLEVPRVIPDRRVEPGDNRTPTRGLGKTTEARGDANRRPDIPSSR